MPIQHTEVKEARGGDFTVLPEDIYQVVVKDIDEKDIQVYGKPQGIVESKYILKLAILDNGEYQGTTITDFVTPSWFNEVGKKNKKGESINPSKLVTIFKAFYGFYNPTINVFDMSRPSVQMVNDLIGKQVRISVKVKNQGEENEKNKITDYTVIKEELEVPETVKVATVAESRKSKPVEDVSEDSFIAELEGKSAGVS